VEATTTCRRVENCGVTEPEVHPAHHAALKVKLARLEQLCGLTHTDAEGNVHHLPAWLRPTEGEPRWPVSIAVLGLIVLQLLVPKHLAFAPRYLLPSLEALLLIVLTVANPRRINKENAWLRTGGLLLVAAASLATAWSAGRLVYQLATGHGGEAIPLLLNGGAIWLTNVIVFALWYWEFDRGGPVHRAHGTFQFTDLLFPQMVSPELSVPEWEPQFVDYLYLSFTNATAFSPTDVMPLARWAKLTMLVQSAVSLALGVLVIARAVNILR
jgi:uncharacterized membrane protein